MKVVRDAVWGDLDLDENELAVIDTPEFQRLRGVRQLGTAYLVYPSANHARFEHSLGTSHVAKKILRQIDASDEERRTIPLAALVHDVTHVPFGHTFEDERRLFPRHDEPSRTREFLGSGDLGRALEKTGLGEPVVATLTGSGPPLGRDIVAGTIGADLLDYLARDAYFTGIRHGYDERLFRYFERVDGRLAVRLHKRGNLREDALSEVVNLLRLRYTLSERVYYHHSKVASGALVSKLVERAMKIGLVFSDLRTATDEGLLARLELLHAPRDPVIGRLLARFRARSLPRRAYVVTRRVGPEVQAQLVERFHRSAPERERIEGELEKECGLEPGDVIVYCPSSEMALKEARVPVDLGNGPLRSLADLNLPEIRDLLEKHRDLWRFYVFIASERRDRAPALSKLCEDRFGARDELVSVARRLH